MPKKYKTIRLLFPTKLVTGDDYHPPVICEITVRFWWWTYSRKTLSPTKLPPTLKKGYKEKETMKWKGQKRENKKLALVSKAIHGAKTPLVKPWGPWIHAIANPLTNTTTTVADQTAIKLNNSIPYHFSYTCVVFSTCRTIMCQLLLYSK